ncbi:hypothetical protein MLD38_031994 [Melastoma candidum]|uniref:Uncharacterized protein n=1 Tax=Melastoma candidum TaxID=119954 RepID=A0ACB9MT99_9MYRT|nr:hypothetical protein MLD38_031994 [Melastoma candidum]
MMSANINFGLQGCVFLFSFYIGINASQHNHLDRFSYASFFTMMLKCSILLNCFDNFFTSLEATANHRARSSWWHVPRSSRAKLVGLPKWPRRLQRDI